MKIKFVLAPHFFNGTNSCLKLSGIVCSDEKAIQPAFTALCNGDGRVSVQKFPVAKTVNVYGINRCGFLTTENDQIFTKWHTLTERTRKEALMCANELSRSFTRLARAVSYSQAEQIAAFQAIREFRSRLLDADAQVSLKAAEAAKDEAEWKTEEPKVEAEWKVADFSTVSAADAQSVIDALVSGNVKVLNGLAYKSEAGVVMQRPATDAENAAQQAKKQETARPSRLMAYFAEDFGPFEAGNFYPCRKTPSYLMVKDDNGCEHSVKYSRVITGDVFTAPPPACATQKSEEALVPGPF